MKITMKTPLLMGYESFSDDSEKLKRRISNTTILQKDENRKIKLMDLPILKKKPGTTLKSHKELPEEENMLESSASFNAKKKISAFEKLTKNEEEIIEIPLEGTIKTFK